MYKNAFAIDKVPYKDRKEKNESSPNYYLNNFNYHLPKLEEDFYYRCFLRTILFDTDIVDIEEFLDFQHEKSEDTDSLVKIIRLKLLPAIKKINKYASIDGEGGYQSYPQLGDGFADVDGVIKNYKYEFSIFYYAVAYDKLKEDLKSRKKIISKWLENLDGQRKFDANLLKWSGKPSHLAFIIRNLVDEGYIQSPLGNNQEINISQLSKQILRSFAVEAGTTENTMRVYLSTDSEKHLNLKKNFDNQGFNLPDSGLIG